MVRYKLLLWWYRRQLAVSEFWHRLRGRKGSHE